MTERSSARSSRRNVTGFLLLAVPSAVAAALLVLAVPYYAGASARIASLYANVAAPADQTLRPEITAYTIHEHHSLAAARRDLSAEVKAEASFDSQLSQITFPPGTDPHAEQLVKADEKRIKLIRLQMQARTLRELRLFDATDQAADVAVEAQVSTIRRDLGLPAASGLLY